MPKQKLTAPFCAEATCVAGKRRTDYYDTSITGFVLECRDSGGKSYYLRYHDAAGRQRQTKIGGYNDITFDQAKRKAKQLRSQVTLGGDPAEDKAVRKAIPLYAELAEQHIAHARTYQKRPENTERIIRLHLSRWNKLRLDEITPQLIAVWLAEKRQSGLAPATVEKMRVMLNRSFELAAKWGIPGAETNPVRAVPRPKFDNKKERFLTAQEAARLIAACRESSNTLLAEIVQLLLYTGARKQELLRARWEHVDLDRRTWFIPDSKTGAARYVPLSLPAMDILDTLPRHCEWVLPNPLTLQPYADLKKPWQTARTKAGLPDLRIHDLRHSAASFMINAGTDLYAVGKVLGHADYQSTMRYSHLANDTLLKAVEAGAAQMEGIDGF